MYVKTVSIRDFRNYESASLSLSPGTNLFVGDNAQGKTNLLEAVYLSSVGRSARTPRDKELIRWGAERAYVRVEVQKTAGDDRVDIVLDRSVNKRVAVNGLPVSRMGELMGVVAAVLFSPDEMKIVKESPSDRRRFMDIALCQMSRAYFYTLARYDKIVSQRNRLLKSGRADADGLDVWDMQLAETGSKIVKTRRGFLARLSAYAAEAQAYLTDGKERLTLSYDGLDGEDVDTVRAGFCAELRRTRESDLRLGYTHVGPHKDDIKIEVGGIDLRSFGSQGQQRTASLALKLAELDLMKDETGEYPILLLDDVLSELDVKRQVQLVSRIRGFQTVITCTKIDDELKAALGQSAVFRVEGGTIARQES